MRAVTPPLAVACLFAMLPCAEPQGYKPHEAAAKMTVADGFVVELVASEPVVRQPVAIEFDDRGRLWVIQYLQYPNPAGLKRVKVDRYSRTEYDRVPEPPPHGPKGADRITILEDGDGDGRADRTKDFVVGLNLATGLALGHGGVFVLQVPYLLFYPDRDGDDVPDGDPQVLLSGFGMQDAHSVANSLTWGPDGWLYGCQGSTVTSNIRGHVFQQGVWRYHPITRRFEVFCDGGGNSWGLDFDAHGQLLYSTNLGGHVLLHGVQGGYYWKQFDKHGAFQNPYTFGHLDHAPHDKFHGGHVTVGGIVYHGDAFPPAFRGKYLGADLLGHALYWHHLDRAGSTFRTRHGGTLLHANDAWFAPCDVTTGPDGAVYVADWHDRRTAHPDPDADWDRTNGRVYRLRYKGAKPAPPPDFAKLSGEQLLRLLSDPNDWIVRRARRVLAERRDPEVILPLRRMLLQSKDEPPGLQALWALYVGGGFSEEFAEQLLGHPSPHVRRWAARFLGDDERVSPACAKKLVALAGSEADVAVRSQLASTARRLPADVALPMVGQLLRHTNDANDAHLPLLLWWAVERHAVPARSLVVERFTERDVWDSAYFRGAILARLMRRYAAEGTADTFDACAKLLAAARGAEDRALLLTSLDQGLDDRPGLPAAEAKGSLFTQFATVGPKKERRPLSKKLPADLVKQVGAGWDAKAADPVVMRLLARSGYEPARQRALALALDRATSQQARAKALGVVADFAEAEHVPAVVALLAGDENDAVRLAALDVLQRVDQADVAPAVLRAYPGLSPKPRGRAVDLLVSRRAWALALLRAVDAKAVPAADVGVDQLRPLALFDDAEIAGLVRKHWGNVRGGTPEEKLAEMRRLANDLRAGPGDPARGRELYRKHCAGCHALFGEGEKVGPDLTHANRKDRDFLLASLVDPGAVVRREYLSQLVQTTDGRLLTGLIVERTAGRLTLVNPRGERVSLAPAQVESVQESPVSLMPEGLLQPLSPQELRDLFAHLQRPK